MKFAAIQILRPQQWLKNLFVFLPLFFDGRLLDWQCWWPCILTFFGFSFAASGIYCLNDIFDAEADRNHPTKSKRPIACGRISTRQAYIIMAGCWILCTIFTIASSLHATIIPAITGVYLLLNIAYCIKLKHKAIADVFIIAFGFVLRVVAGGTAAEVWLSEWFILMTFLLALFLAFSKRRDDVVIYEKSGVKTRSNINRYTTAFMNQALSIVASITIVCYIMYTMAPEVIERMGSRHIYATSVFVLGGITRYLQVTMVDSKSGSPTHILMHDRIIQACIAGWLIAFCLIIYC